MNKIWLFGASICMVLALGSCKPKQSAYKAAYEQAKEKESTAPVEVVEEEEVVEEVLRFLNRELPTSVHAQKELMLHKVKMQAD